MRAYNANSNGIENKKAKMMMEVGEKNKLHSIEDGCSETSTVERSPLCDAG